MKWHGVLPTIHSNSVFLLPRQPRRPTQWQVSHQRWRFETKGHAEWIAEVNETGPIVPVAYKAVRDAITASR